ncbi:MAG: hypothetical protein ACOC7U_04995, partial [Spirochaetota bacterium]
DMHLEVSFNSDFSLHSVADLVSLDPSLGYYLEKKTQEESYSLCFMFEQPMAPEESYRIRFDSAVCNIHGMPLDNEYVFGWVVNGANSRLLKVEKIEIVDPLKLSNSVIYEDGECYHNRNMLLDTTADESRVEFNILFTAPVEVYRALEEVFLEFCYGNVNGVTGELVEYQWDSQNNQLILCFLLPVIDQGPDSYYKLVLNGGEDGLVDSWGNYMSETLELYTVYDVLE